MFKRLFHWFVPKGANPEDLQYMSEVDVALHSRGHPLAFILSLAVLLFFACFLVWASYAKLDEITRGMGQVIPSQRTQEIQNLEGGILESMLVREGEIVEPGQALLRLSPNILEATVRDAQTKKVEAEASIIRMEAELAGNDPVFPSTMEIEYPQIVSDQLAAFVARRAQFEGEALALESEIEQRKQEVEVAQSREQSIRENLRFTIEQINMIRPLVDKGTYPRLEYLKILQQKSQLDGELNTVLQSINQNRTAVRGAEQRLANRENEWRSQVTEELNKRRSELNSILQNIAATSDRLRRTEISSPVRGKVNRIMINTIGGVIRPGDTILELVPLDDTLMVEARIRPTDIAFIQPQQKAVIKITAYDFSIYGGLEGFVEDISGDTIEDKRGDPYYVVKLRTQNSTLLSRTGDPLPIIPGMQASVDIITGEKTVLAYLLKPIIKASQNAMTER
ncbi:HlyD family type I secretion periplasmic adaptor subunit [Desulfovibrio sp. OttesenSCG-928-I05]|nr:HlyD family type I secretion periplasmic adaptor subunit [Desulfovibrio sp. OttesenSCG-928-I05]